MSETSPEPTAPRAPRTEVLLGYIDPFRARVVTGVERLAEDQRRASLLPSGRTPLELVRHLMFVERRWIQWGFEGLDVGDPWGDERRAGGSSARRRARPASWRR